MIDDNDSPGIQAIYELCYALYPDQPTPPQVTALQKFWLGGPDPLDFISMYENPGLECVPGDQFSSSPPHWHYITYGLSDLYGDARLHDQPTNQGPSGFGFELTFRLKRGNETKAPLWPAMLLQSLGRYLFRSQAKFAPGDHVPWGRSLEDIGSGPAENEFSRFDSRITNMLIAIDAQLNRIDSKHGSIDFLQVVGICDEEMQLARRWSGIEMTTVMRKRTETGGALLVTDMRRGESLTELEANLIAPGGSNLSGVTTEIAWGRWGSLDQIIDVVGDEDCVPVLDSVQSSSETPFYGINVSPGTLELLHPHFLDNVHLKISKDAGEIMHSVIKDRLKFQRHFTFLHCRSDMAVTLVTENITGTFVSEDKPYGFRGAWLQILVNKELLNEMETSFSNLTKLEAQQLPLYLRFSKFRLLISIHSSSHLDMENPELDEEVIGNA